MLLKRFMAFLVGASMLAPCIGVLADTESDGIVTAREAVFSDDFSGNAVWNKEKGSDFSRNPTEGVLSYDNTNQQNVESILTAGDTAWSDYIYSADITFSRGNYAGMFFRYRDADNHYLLQIYRNNGEIILLRRTNGSEYTDIKKTKYRFENGKTYNLSVSAQNSVITVTVDGTEIMKAEDSAITDGKIGLKGQYASFKVDNVVVETEYIDEEKSDVFKYSKPAKQIYVSPDGNDDNRGDKDSPLKTVEAAKSLANIKKIGGNPVEVIFKEGKYLIDKTVSFTSSDSGSAGAPIVYKAEDGANVVFTGAAALDISAFKPVSGAVYERLPKASADHVLQLDLKKQGIEKSVVDLDTNRVEGGSGIPLGIYLNGKRQSVSRWPNTGYNTFLTAGVLEAGGVRRWGQNPDVGAVFKYSEINPSKWKDVSNSYLVGYFGAEFWGEWAKIKRVDAEQNTIELSRWTQYGVKEGYRWSVMNVLEEIDIPGEYYIDYNDMMLYYYPPYEIEKGRDSFEISLLTDDMLNVSGTKYLEFKDIAFEENRGNGLVFTDIKNINLDGCTIRNIGINGVIVGGTYATIQNCDIYWTGEAGIYFTGGGEKKTLTSGHNVVTNNHVYDTQRDGLSSQGSHFRGDGENVGFECTHNYFHRSDGAMYGLRGNDNITAYNEVWNASRATSDSTAVGTGRKWTEYGDRYEYNYIHDVGSPTFKGFYTVNGLFWDDTQSGQIARYNIINMNNKNNTAAIRQGGGRDNVVEYNILLNSDISINGENRTGSLDITTYDAYKDFISSGIDYSKPPFIDKYPMMNQVLTDIENDGKFIPRNDIIRDNVFANTNKTTISTAVSDYGTVENNLETDDMDIFVDAANQDFRITDAAKEKYGLSDKLLGENFDWDSIGIQREVTIPKGEFNLLYPQNNAKNIETRDFELFWEDALLADEYRYVIAADENFSDIVEEGTSLEPYVTIDKIENGRTYFWKVYARYISKKNPAEWESVSKTFTFTTAERDTVEKAYLEASIKKLEELSKTITESDTIGGYAAGTKEEIKKLIAKSNVIMNDTTAAQDTVNAAAMENNNFVSTVGAYVNVGYKALKIGDISTWKWSDPTNSTIAAANGELTINKGGPGAEFVLKDTKLPTNEILCFDAKSDLKGWYGLSMRQSNQAVGYSNESSQYMIVIKPDIFELQKYRKDGSVRAIIETAENNGIIKANEWYSIQLGAIDLNGGVELLFKVNGKTVFDYIDTNKPIYEPGYFVVTHYQEGSSVSLRETTDVPTGIYQKPEVVISTVYTNTDEAFSQSGAWEANAAEGYDGTAFITSAEKGAKASWLLYGEGTKTYKVYYWNDPSVTTDKEVKVHLKNYNIEETLTLDMTAQEKGWVELGEYIFITAQAGDGELNVEFEASGGGTLGVSAMKIEKVK